MDATSETRMVVRPHEGPQWQFFESTADIVIYGGQAGGGKTFALVADPLRNVDRPGFRAGIFRRSYPQLKGQGGIWDEACQIYPQFGARMREGQELDATFPSGANIAFLHLQHEQTKFIYQGHQFAYLGFDELTHFSESQFFYLLSRNRTTCGIPPRCRCTCNPDAGSWVADFIAWWIDPETGWPIQERSGVVRYFVREDDRIVWADTPEKLIEIFPLYKPADILSATFIPARLEDNPSLMRKDPGYRGKLLAQPRVERERLLGNWKSREGAIIEHGWLRRYVLTCDHYQTNITGKPSTVPANECRRFATIDTAGTSKERARALHGDPPSWSVCAVWDYHHRFDLLILVHVWRAQVEWNELKVRVPDTLRNWRVPLAIIEDAHYGKPLASELVGVQVQMSPTVIHGMDDASRGAKLERAIASGFLSRIEDGKIVIPQDDFAPWVRAYVRELTVWTGLPTETSDQIDVSSHASQYCRKQVSSWGGVIDFQSSACPNGKTLTPKMIY